MNIFDKTLDALTEYEINSIYELTRYDIIIKDDNYVDIVYDGELITELSQYRTVYYALQKILYYIEQEKINEGKEQIKEQFRYLLK